MTDGTKTNDPLVGTTYDGRYRIERRIGAGGMANVYLAEDETLGRRVAIKVLHQRYAEDSQFVERFLREASAAARLNHPNIVQVYDRGQSDHTYYIAMEYVDGMTLKELVQRRGGLTEQEVLAYGRQALHALRFAHRNGIVHRDVKPHNMMVDTDGRLKIADFGIARAGADSGLTEAGSIVGTAQYLSPEQAQGHDVAATSDLYSLGVVMFEMATGRVPFDGDSPVNVALKHVKDPVPTPSSLNRTVSPQLESIILKAMEKDPSLRYASADEMLGDLDRAREGSSTAAMTQVLGTTRSDATATQVTPIVPAVAPAAARVYETPIAPEPAWPERDWEDEREERRSVWRWLLPLVIVLLLVGAAAYFLLADRGVVIPDVEGQTVAQARQELADAGFTIGEVRTEFSEEIAKSKVIGTDPDSGERADKGSEVDIVVSQGQEPVAIPNVENMSLAAAQNALEDAGFKWKIGQAESSDKIKKGNVIRTSPAAGVEQAPGTTVTIIQSSGKERAEVPSVIGQTCDQATETLTGDEFKFTVTCVEADSSHPRGEVVKQSPAPGSQLVEGGKVTLTVASGTNEVPGVQGAGEDDAVSTLQAAGFEVNVVHEPTDDPGQIGVVISQDPSGGTADVSSTVDIVVGEATGDSGDGGVPVETTPGNANGHRKHRH
jgi:serine/threonine-protein kinase